MIKIIEKINKNPYWVFFLGIYSLKDLIYKNHMFEYNTNFDWIAFAINMIIIFLLYFLMKKYNEINDKITFKESKEFILT